MNNKRFIKNYTGGEIITVPANNELMHPLSSQWIKTDKLVNPICLTKFQIENNETQIGNSYPCKQNIDNYKSYLFIPPIGLLSTDLLKIFDVESIDKLHSWIKNNIEEKYVTACRLVNCWVRVNYDTLKDYNNILVKLINILFKYYFGDMKIDYNEKFDKEIKDYIDYWLNKNKNTDIKLTIVEDFMNFYIKKYKLKNS